ncbi:hypothetical protein ACWFMI_28360 [Nocardiopsis terrae]
MYPQPPQPGPTPSLEQAPAPGPVNIVAVMLWLTVTVALIVLTINMTTAPMAGVEPGYAFGASLHYLVIAALLGVTAVPLIRGHSWARTMTKVVLIIQIVLQSLSLLGGTGFLWALLLLPMAITALVQLHHPLSKWFFAVHNPAANQEYLRQHAVPYYPQQQYPPQGYGQQPPQYGPWNQNPHQQ